MGIWTERILQHTIWQTLNEIGSAIDQGFARPDIDSDSIEALNRLKTVLTFSGKRLAGLDPYLVYPGQLDSIQSYLAPTLSSLQTFIAQGSPASLHAANSSIDTALHQLAQLVYPITPDDTGSLKDAAVSYRRTLEDVIASVKGKSAELADSIVSLSGKLNEISAEASAEKARTASALSEFQSQFSKSQDVRQTEFSKAISELQSGFIKDASALAKQSETELDALAADYEAKAADIFHKIKARQLEVEKLVGVIGNLGVTSGHVKAADHAKVTTWIWQGLTIGSFAGLIWMAYRVFAPSLAATYTWPEVVSRALLTITVGLAAVYCASQADKYRVAEKKNRQLALELEALGPFLAPLDHAEQSKFRLMVGEKSFGHSQVEEKHNDRSPASMLDLLKDGKTSKEFRELLLELVKAGKS